MIPALPRLAGGLDDIETARELHDPDFADEVRSFGAEPRAA